MDAALNTVLAEIDAGRDRILADLSDLIRLQSEGEEAVQRQVAGRLEASGASVETLRYEPTEVPVVGEFSAAANSTTGERASIIGTYAGAGGGRSVILFAHPDGEPVAATETWSHQPFDGVIDGGKIYGWGVADDLAGVSLGVSAMEMLRKAGITLAGEVQMASTPSKRHARGVAALLHHGYGADASLYLHPAESGVGMNEIKALTSGQLEFTVTVRGKRPPTTEPGLTAFAHMAVNPLDKAFVLIGALKALDAARGARIHHPRLDAAVQRSTNILISSVQFGTGRAFSRLPMALTFGAAISFPPSETMQAVQAEVEACLAAAADADPWLKDNRPELAWVSGVTGVEVEESHPLFQAVAGAVETVCGFHPHVNPLHTSSDIRNPMVQKGIPTLGFGPFSGGLTQSGGTDEWVDVEDYIRAVKVLAASLIAWCGVAETPPGR